MLSTKHLVSAKIFLVLSLCAGISARAELADRDKPINIESNKMTADDNKKLTYFEGQVILTQGTIRLTADHMTVHEDAAGFKYASAYGSPNEGGMMPPSATIMDAKSSQKILSKARFKAAPLNPCK